MSAGTSFSRSKSPFLFNKRSLPKEVHSSRHLHWRPIYDRYSRLKIENRWQQIKAIKNKGGEDWRSLLQAAKVLIQELGKSSKKKTNVSYFVELSLTFLYFNNDQKDAKKQSQASNSDIEVNLEDLNDLDYAESPKSKENKNKKQVQLKAPTQKMTGKDNNSGAIMPIGAPLVSDAEADVVINSGPVENVYMSDAYYREETEPDGTKYKYTYNVIIVLCTTMTDADSVTCRHLGSAGGNKTIRISKFRVSSILQNRNAKAIAGQMNIDFASQSGLTSALTWYTRMSQHILIDVHFENDVQPRVMRLEPTKIQCAHPAYKACSKCGMEPLLELPNIAIFEVKHVNFIEVSSAPVGPRLAKMTLSE